VYLHGIAILFMHEMAPQQRVTGTRVLRVPV
jgi:hypothetical protein